MDGIGASAKTASKQTPVGGAADADGSTQIRKNVRMIVDLRIYTTRPGKLAAFVKLYRDHAWNLQQKHLGECLGWYTTIEGTLNQVVHLWRYESQADREARRAAMVADPAWGDYLRRSEDAGLLVAQENRILKPTDFFPQR